MRIVLTERTFAAAVDLDSDSYDKNFVNATPVLKSHMTNKKS